ncbi:MAG: hypothetical protein QOF42_1622 [Gammaproteobacteria bacterium]|nr:hypothetical protein [Gammaproteobacteria bacterium]
MKTRRLQLSISLTAAILVSALAFAANSRPRAAGIPRSPDGKPDLSGIWQTTSAADFDLQPHSGRKDAPPGAGIVEGGMIPYTPDALAAKQKNLPIGSSRIRA